MRQAFSKAAEPTAGSLLAAIVRERPELRRKLSTVKFIDSGKNAYIIFIGDEVFKAPRPHQDMEAFRQEMATQKALAKAGLPVAAVGYTGKQTLFYGMQRLPGVTLYDVRAEITPEQKQVLAQGLADFTIRMAQTLPMKYGRYAQPADLHSLNVLVDPVTKKLTGVIDFANIQYLSPEYLGDVQLGKEMNKMVREEYTRRQAEVSLPAPKKHRRFHLFAP
jgi:hypothetical protein